MAQSRTASLSVLERIEERLIRIEQKLDQHDDVLDTKAASALMGISAATLYTKTCYRNGLPPEIPHFKKGKRLYFRRSDLVRWLSTQRVSSADDIRLRALNHKRAQRKRDAAQV